MTYWRIWTVMVCITCLSPGWAQPAHSPPLVTLTPAEQAFLHEHPQLTLGTGDAWEPYVIVGADGQVTGYDADVLAHIKRVTGLNIRLLPGDWRQRQLQAQHHEIDGLSTGGVHAERRAYLNFSDPYIRLHKLVLVAKGNPFNLRSHSDLDGRSIAIHRGNLSDEKLALQFPRSRIVPLDTVDAVINAVVTGQVDATFDNGAMLYHANRIGSPYLQFAFSLNETLDLAFGVRKDWPLAISIINKGLRALPEAERMRIQARWFMTPVEFPAAQTNALTLTDAENAFLERLGTIRLCIDPDWMPFTARTATGEMQGIFNDVVTLVMQRLGRTVTLVPTMQWEQSLTAMRTGRCDIISGIAITPERSEYLDFTRPLFIESLVVAVRNDTHFAGDIAQHLDRQFVMVAGHAAIELMRRQYPAMHITETDTVATALQAVATGDAFGYIDLLPTIAWTAQQQGILNVKIVTDLSAHYELAIGVRKDIPLLWSSISKAVISLSADELAAIRNRWASIRYEQRADYRWLWPYVVVWLLLLLIMFIWNRRLNSLNQALRRANAKIELLTITDELTGLFNRRHFHSVMQREWQRALRDTRLLHLVLVDIDHFKHYNDTYGHPAGDTVLRQIGALLRHQSRRAGDFAFRLGGEEFAVLLTDLDHTAAQHFAESLRTDTEQLTIPHATSLTAPVVTLSLGLLSVIPSTQGRRLPLVPDWNSIYQNADALLYQAKNTGRNRVVAGCWQVDPLMDADSRHR